MNSFLDHRETSESKLTLPWTLLHAHSRSFFEPEHLRQGQLLTQYQSHSHPSTHPPCGQGASTWFMRLSRYWCFLCVAKDFENTFEFSPDII